MGLDGASHRTEDSLLKVIVDPLASLLLFPPIGNLYVHPTFGCEIRMEPDMYVLLEYTAETQTSTARKSVIG